MRLWIVSDLHTNSHFWVPERIPRHDAMIVAGDLADMPVETVRNLHQMARWSPAPIIFVAGNHDVSRLDDMSKGSRRLDAAGVHVLGPGISVTIDAVRFVGSTLWTDFQLHDTEWASQAWAAKYMPEYQHVRRQDGGLIWPRDVYDEHQWHRRALNDALFLPHDGPTVVVTHHAPSIRSVHPGDRTLPECAAFASDLEELILRHQPELWVHGHIHHSSDYRIGATRVVCNPRGYVTEAWSERTGWTEDLVIEV